jgi:hypothetical protein
MNVLAALLGTVLISVSTNDASALFAKHAQYVGWQAGDPSVQGWVASGSRNNGHGSDTLTEKRSGIAYHDTLSAAGGRVSQDSGFTGSLVWESDPNGYTVTQTGTPAQVAYDLNLVRAEDLSSIAGPSVTGSAQVNGITTTVIRIKPSGAAPLDIYEDPSSGAFLQVIVDPDGPARTVVAIDGYAEAEHGKKVVSGWTIGNLHYAFSSISAAPVADSDLVPPRPRPVWQFGGASIPVELYDLAVHLYQPRVALSVNGVSGIFVIDTGTQSIVLFDNFASRAGVESIDGADFSPFSGNARYKGYGFARTVTAGNNTLQNVLVERISAPDTRLAGLIGYDFFAKAIAEIDLSHKTMQLFDPSSMQPTITSGAYAFPLDLTSRRPVIAVPLSGGAHAFPYFSTGEPFFMMLSQRLRDTGAVSAADVSVENFNPSVNGRTFLGTMIESNAMHISYSDYMGAYGSGNCALLHQILIGPYRYQSPPLCFVGSGVFGEDGGAIGNDFLRHFDWTIDYPDAKFVLTPNSIQ